MNRRQFFPLALSACSAPLLTGCNTDSLLSYAETALGIAGSLAAVLSDTGVGDDLTQGITDAQTALTALAAALKAYAGAKSSGTLAAITAGIDSTKGFIAQIVSAIPGLPSDAAAVAQSAIGLIGGLLASLQGLLPAANAVALAKASQLPVPAHIAAVHNVVVVTEGFAAVPGALVPVK